MAVLLVEDDAMVRLTLAGCCQDAGIDCLEAGNAEDALTILDDTAPRIDVLVTDVNLGPGDSGLALATKAPPRRPELPVIYETGSREMLAGRGFCPWQRVFCKPFDPVALAAAVSALNSSRHPGRHHQRPATSNTVASSL